MHFFGLSDDGELDPNASNRGILCINHENITQFLMHEMAEVARDADGGPRRRTKCARRCARTAFPASRWCATR